MAIPSIARMQDRNLVGICHLDVVEADQVQTVPDELNGNVATTVTLKAGGSWKRVYLDDDGGLFAERWVLEGGAQYSIAQITGAIAKDRLSLMPNLWRMKGKRYLVLFTTRNGDQLLMGRIETPAVALVRERTAGEDVDSDRNQYEILFELTRRMPVPFYQGTPPAAPGACPTLAEQIPGTPWATIEGLLDEEQLADAEESLGGACPTLCEQMDGAFTGGGAAGIDVVLNGVAGTIPETGTANGKPLGFLANWNGSGFDADYIWDGAQWMLTNGVLSWTSSDDVATPGLVTTWVGPDPLPTVEDVGGPLDASAIVGCWDEDQLAAVIEELDLDPGTVKTTDGVDTVLTVAPGGSENLPQSKVFFEDATGTPDEAGPYDTALVAGTLYPDAYFPRRQILLTGGTGTGKYASLGALIADTLPTIPQQVNATWAAGDDTTIGITFPASMQGVAFSFVSETGSNGTITVSVNNGSSYAAPPFTPGASKVLFKRTTFSAEQSALFATS